MAAVLPKEIVHEENLETFCLIWLDASVNNSRENVQAQEQLKRIINYLLTFDDDQQCLHYIKNLSDSDRVILVVSGRYGRIIIPKIANMQKITSIYIFCFDKQANEQWSKDFARVKGVVVQLDELVQSIKQDYTQQQFNKIDEPLLIKFCDDKETSNSTYEEFLYSQLLIDCLIRMPSSPNDIKELVNFCIKYYQKNYTETTNVKEFEKKYSSDEAIRWYTRYFFLYQLLNKALYTQNIDLLLLFRFFIRDIAFQLAKDNCSPTLRAYRSQMISKERFEILLSSVGKYISINTFLSATTNKDETRSILYADDGSNDMQKVCFEIKIQSRSQTIRPFNHIGKYTYYPNSNEVLFMAGSIFQITKIEFSENKFWVVRMSLRSLEHEDLQPLLEDMKKGLGVGNTSLFELSNLLQRMQKLKDAEKYYRRYLNQLPNDHQHITNCYHAFGKIAELKKNFTLSLKWYERSVDIFLQTQKSNDAYIAGVYNDIGTVYLKTHNYAKARQYFRTALKIWESVGDHNYSRLVQCLNQIGFAYEMKRKLDEALQHYQKALSILQLRHSSRYVDIGLANQNIARVYEQNGDYQKALAAYQQALKFFRCSLPSTEIYVNEIEKSIRQLSATIK